MCLLTVVPIQRKKERKKERKNVYYTPPIDFFNNMLQNKEKKELPVLRRWYYKDMVFIVYSTEQAINAS